MGVKISFDGISSEDYGLVVTEAEPANVPERDVTMVDIPGRDGLLSVDNGKYKNVTVAYGVAGRYPGDMAEFLEKIASVRGYAKLTESIFSDSFRMARLSGGIGVDMVGRTAARAGLTFDCKPQRFLNSGEVVQTFSAAGSLINPTGQEALPLITVHGSGSGTASVGGVTVTISQITDGMIIDSENKNVYKGTNNLNSKMSGPFPTLPAGTSGVAFTGGVTGVDIKPRWWKL